MSTDTQLNLLTRMGNGRIAFNSKLKKILMNCAYINFIYSNSTLFISLSHLTSK